LSKPRTAVLTTDRIAIMKLSPEARLAAAVAYAGLTLFLFDSVASLARPTRVEAQSQHAKESIVVAKVAVPQPR
jgi:hypothetical protein